MSQQTYNGTPLCETCLTLHELDQPCPLRIASAYTMQAQALEKLTEADKKLEKELKDLEELNIQIRELDNQKMKLVRQLLRRRREMDSI